MNYEWNWVESRPRQTDLRYGGLFVGFVLKWTAKADQPKPWRAWLMHDDEGDQVGGWFATPEAAKSVLLAAGQALLAGEPVSGIRARFKPVTASSS